MTLEDLGFSPALAEALEALSPGAEPARVVATLSDSLRVVTPRGDTVARISGRLRHSAASPSELPAVGDWVALRRERIAAVLPRRTTLSRKVPGRRAEEHVVAANVDTVIIVMGVDDDYSTRRLERYLATVWESGARPVVLLSKADLDPTVDARVREVEGLAIGTPVIAASVVEGRGVDQLRALLLPRETNVLVGSSGVGKSTLINTLLGEDRQATRATSARDARGQHTTTHRELFRLPGGSLLIDSPGIRELQLWVDEESLSRSFGDIAALALECRYRDCAHQGEPDCAVAAAVTSGTLDAARLESFHALQQEIRYLEARQSESAERLEKQKWRDIHREMRTPGKHRGT